MNLSQMKCQVTSVYPKIVQAPKELDNDVYDFCILMCLLFLAFWAFVLCGLYA